MSKNLKSRISSKYIVTILFVVILVFTFLIAKQIINESKYRNQKWKEGYLSLLDKKNMDQGNTIIMQSNSIYYFDDSKCKLNITDKKELYFMISEKKVSNWCLYYVTEFEENPNDIWLGFSSENNGWIVVNGDVSAGTQFHYIFLTNDSGKTWTELGNTNASRSKMLSGTGFSDKNIGFLNFVYTDGSEGVPEIYQSLNAGQSWKKLSIKLPIKFEDSSAEALSPIFDGAKGILPIQIRDNDGAQEIYYYSDDYGRTWNILK